jgi:hypothetical protein
MCISARVCREAAKVCSTMTLTKMFMIPNVVMRRNAQKKAIMYH